jgi:phytoene desaturase
VNGDVAAIERQIESFDAADRGGYRSFAAASERIFAAGFRLIDQPFHELGAFARVVPELLRLRADRSVGALAEKHLRDDRLRQVFSFHPLLIGGNPFATTSIYALIHPLEKRWGVWFPMGGMASLVAALVRLFTDVGGALRFSSGADAIVVDDVSGRATGVRLSSGEILSADVVVSNADVLETHRRLLPDRFRGRLAVRRMGRLEYSMSVFVVYFGTDRRYDDVGHHEILMGPRYRELLADIFVHKRLASDFSLYLYRPTATDPSLAPAGGDTFYALSPVPNLSASVDWDREGPRYRESILRYVESSRLPNLGRHLVTVSHVDPRYFRDELGTPLGSAFSVAPTLTQSAWFRPHNVSGVIPNLYFVGAGTHPGAGIPGVLSSAKIVDGLIASREGGNGGRERVAGL